MRTKSVSKQGGKGDGYWCFRRHPDARTRLSPEKSSSMLSRLLSSDFIRPHHNLLVAARVTMGLASPMYCLAMPPTCILQDWIRFLQLRTWWTRQAREPPFHISTGVTKGHTLRGPSVSISGVFHNRWLAQEQRYFGVPSLKHLRSNKVHRLCGGPGQSVTHSACRHPRHRRLCGQ